MEEGSESETYMITLSNRTRGTLMVLVAVTVLSVDGLLIRQVSADRWTLICWRGLFMFFSLSIWLIVCWRRRIFSKFCAIGWTGIIAAVILAIGNILFVSAFTLTSIANTLVIVNSAPLLVALLSWLILREKVPGRTWIAILVGLGGVAVIFHASLIGGSLTGELCALGAAGIFAAYLIFLRHAREINMIPSLALSGVLTAIFILPAARPFSVSGSDLGIFFLMGGISLPIGLGLITIAPRYIPPTEVSLIMLLEAVLGSTWAWMILSEIPGPESLLGGAIVIGALVFNSLAGWKSSRPL
jgi:drug/metabolite transporter (DMT)-like permease